MMVEELLRTVAVQPLLKLGQLLGVGPHVRERHLVGAERSLHGQSVDHLGSGPAFRGAQDDHGPVGATHTRSRPRLGLDLRNAVEGVVKSDRHALVDLHRVLAVEATLDEKGVIAIPRE